MPLPYAETSGTSPESIYDNPGILRRSAWGLSWGFSWANAWGFVRSLSPFPNTNNSAEAIYEENSGSGSPPFPGTSGTSPDEIYEEN